ncbi:MAG: DUF3858 domain-containing protein, partial [Acidobacteria bacterium]|nr:DUF3858 domain-containing protein [Acidobacteriota bacterium]
ERKFPVEIPYPLTQVYDITYQIPAASAITFPQEKELNSKYGYFKRTVKKENDKVNIVSKVSLVITRVDVSDYKEFKSFLSEVDKLASERIQIKW